MRKSLNIFYRSKTVMSSCFQLLGGNRCLELLLYRIPR
jgi:hypothetical protein